MKFSFIVIFVTLSQFIKNVSTEWPDCGNFAAAKGYPAGCMSSLNSFCVNQDSECADLVCTTNVKNLFRTCNEFCEGSNSNLPNGLQCICLTSSTLVCPGPTSRLLESETETQSLVLPTTEERPKRAASETFWGAKIKSPDFPQIIVYCTGEKTRCDMSSSLCEQQNCYAGQCFFEDHCYFANPYIDGESECNDGSKPIGVETVEEREHIFFILNETYPGTQLKKVGTSGIVRNQTTDGVWNGWDQNMTPEVVDVIDSIEMQTNDQYLGITRDECGEVVWEFFSGEAPAITMCEIELNSLWSTTTDVCDTTETPTDHSSITNTATHDGISQSDTSTSTITQTTEFSTNTDATSTLLDITTASQGSSDSTVTSSIEITESTDITTETTTQFTTDESSSTLSQASSDSTSSIEITESTDITTETTTQFTTDESSSTLSQASSDSTTVPSIKSTASTGTTNEYSTVTSSTDDSSTSIVTDASTDNTVSTLLSTLSNTPEPISDTTSTQISTSTISIKTDTDLPTNKDPTDVTNEFSTLSVIITNVSSTVTPTSNITSTVQITTVSPDDTTTDDTTTTSEESTTTPSSTDDPNSCKEPCIKEGQYEELWECCPNTTCKKECPLNAEGDAVWFCAFNSTYISTVPDYSGCHNIWVDDLNNRINNNNISSWDLLKNTDLYATEDSLFGHEMADVIHFSNTSMSLLIEEQKAQRNSSMSSKLDERRYMAESTLRVIDRILKYNKQWEQLKEYEQVQLGMQMQNTTDFLGFSVTDQARLIGKPFFMVSEWPNSHMEAQYIIYNPNEASGPIVKYPIEPSYFSKGSAIEFRGPQWIKLQMNNFTVETVGNSLPMAIAEMIFPARYNSMEDSKKQLNSEMISLSMLNAEKVPLTSFPEESIWVTFVHEYESDGPVDSTLHRDLYPDEKPTAILGSQQCAFWNTSLSYNGQWDTSGCRLVSHTKYETVCTCNHLSSFALLMDVHDYVGKDPVMKILSIVCSIASVICLLLTLFILHFLKGVQGERNSIGKHVCLCLVIGHIICLILLDQALLHLPDEMCIAVGVVLHYVFLAAFMWMAVEGHHLYRLVIRVFDSGKDLSRLYLIVAYGTPAIIVAITGIIALASPDKVYGADGLCWLAMEKYIWAFMGPVFFLTALNLLILILALRVAVKAGTHQKKSVIDRARIWIRGWFSLSALLGITWLFGFVYMEWYYNLAYVFIVLTGLQGVFIFLSRVVFNDQVKSAFKRSAKKRSMMNRFYKLAWKNRSEGSSMQQSSWFLAGSSSSQLDLTSSSSYWDHTPSRRRSSITHPDSYTDPEKLSGSLMQHSIAVSASSGQSVATVDKQSSNSSWHILKRRHSKEEEDTIAELPPYYLHQSGDIQQAWGNRTDLDILTEIPEEDEEPSNSTYGKY